jgi:hypothetical protein
MNTSLAGRSASTLVRCSAILVLLGMVPTSAGPQTPALPQVPPELGELRAALQKYEDPIVAVHDGYFSTVGCVEVGEAPGPGAVPAYAVGGMGIHFINPMLLGPDPDPRRPPILLYEPVGEQLRLVAAEWFVPLSTGVKKPPTLFGHVFDGPMEGHHPVMPGDLHHYDLHVWLWKDNPIGLFKPINPAVKCGNYRYTVKLKPPRIVAHR